MDGLLVPILIAATVGSGAWALANALATLAGKSKRKLQRRLSNENRDELGGVNPVAKQITIQLDVRGVPKFMAGHPLVQGLNRRVVQAYPNTSLGKFLAVSAGISLGSGALSLLVSASAAVGFFGLILGAYLPFVVLSRKRARRQKLLAQQLPEALDLLSRVLQAGHSLSTGLQLMGEELPSPLGEEFRRAYDQHSLGQSFEQAMTDMSVKLESQDFSFFVTAMLIQRQTGGDLSEVLKNIGGMIRQRVRLQQTVKAKTAEGRFTGYILVAFPAFMFMIAYMMNPDYAGVLINTTSGLKLLGTAVTMQVLGLLAIRKVTTVKI